jgi:hypothetical protein
MDTSKAELRADLIEKFGSGIEDNEELLAECPSIPVNASEEHSLNQSQV